MWFVVLGHGGGAGPSLDDGQASICPLSSVLLPVVLWVQAGALPYAHRGIIFIPSRTKTVFVFGLFRLTDYSTRPHAPEATYFRFSSSFMLWSPLSTDRSILCASQTIPPVTLHHATVTQLRPNNTLKQGATADRPNEDRYGSGGILVSVRRSG